MADYGDGAPSIEDLINSVGASGVLDGGPGHIFAPPIQGATLFATLPPPPAAVPHAVTRTVLFKFKVEPKKQWPKLKVPIPEPACSSPSAMLAYLRTAPDVPGFLKFALGHKKATVATEAPFAEKSHVVALSDGVCFTSNDSNWGQLLPPTDGAELFLMVDCPGCSEHRFAMLQTPEPASLDVAACRAGDKPQIWKCTDCNSKDNRKRKKSGNGSQSPPQHTAAPPWVHDTDTDGNEVIRTRSDAIVHASLEVKENVTVQGKLVQRSDQRTKGNIQPTGADEDAANLEHLRHVDIVSYDETQGPMAGQHVDHGFIAQNLQAEFPGTVQSIGPGIVDGAPVDDLIGVDHGAMLAVAFSAMKAVDRNEQRTRADVQHLAEDVAQNTADITKLKDEQELANQREAKMAEEIAQCREVIAALSAQCDHLEQNSKTVSPAAVEKTTLNIQVLRVGLVCQSVQLQHSVDPSMWENYKGPTSSIDRLLMPSAATATPQPTGIGMGGTLRATDSASDADVSTSSDASVASRSDDASNNPSRSRHWPGAGTDDVPVSVIPGSSTVSPPLREYQQYVFDELLKWYAAPPRNPLAPDVAAVVLPTGAGKTSIAFELLLHAVRQQDHQVAVFLAPTVALIEQQARRFVLRRDVSDSNLTVRLVAGGAAKVLCGSSWSGGLQIVFATPQSYNQWDQRRELEPVSVLVLDESHHAKLSARTNHPYQLALDGSGPGAKVVGLSATPEAFLERDPKIITVAAGERGLVRNQIVEFQIDIMEFFPQKGRLLCGHLLELEAIRKRAQQTKNVDTLKLAVTAQRLYRNIGWSAVAADLDLKGSYDDALKLSSKPIRQSPVIDAVITVLSEAWGRATDRQPQVIVYCDHKESAKLLTLYLTGLRGPTSPPKLAWVRPALITSKQSKTETKQVLDDFHSTKVNVLVATSCIREGIDVPGCNLVIAVEPPKSNLDNTQLKGRARSLHSKYIVITVGSNEQNAFANVAAEAPPVAPAENPDADAQDHHHLDQGALVQVERVPGPQLLQQSRPTSDPRDVATAPDACWPGSAFLDAVPPLARVFVDAVRSHATPSSFNGQFFAELDKMHAKRENRQEPEPEPGANLPLPDQIMRALAARGRAMTALELAKEVGWTTASDVNPHVYALQKSGQVETHSKSGSKPCWSLAEQ